MIRDGCKHWFAICLSGIVFGWAQLQGQPPNVVLIVVDDLGFADLSCTGLADDVETPNIDRLAAQGVRFTEAYATAPICNASRIALITGCYQQRQGNHWYSGPGLHDPSLPTVAEILKTAGYQTAYIGKFHHSGRSDGPQGRGFPLNHGFDYLYGFAGGTKHYLRHKREFQFEGDMLHQGPIWVNDALEDVEGFTTDLIGAQSRAWMRRNKERSFYLHVSFNAVHNYTHQLPESYLKENGIEPFADWDPAEEGYWDWRGRIGYPAHPEGRNYYLGQLDLLDREIGRIMDELDALSIRDRTAVILVSDNGGSLVTYANNGYLNGGKYTLFEGGIRVPMIMSYPKALPPGRVTDFVASTLDLLPTICRIAGADAPSGIDGLDLMVSLSNNGPSTNSRAPLYWDTGHESAIRDGPWKLLVTRRTPNERLQITPTPVGTFLYNLRNDPGESQDLTSNYPEIRDRLKARLNEWRGSISPSKATL